MNRFTTIILICLASLLSFASNSHKEVVIEGKVLGFSDKSAQIITAIDCNPWSHGSLKHAVKIDSSGTTIKIWSIKNHSVSLRRQTRFTSTLFRGQ